jgi:ABC-type multidrug transport system ATPase subunit
MLSGFAKPSFGDGLIFGYSLVNQIYDIRSFMGMCPQYDILFPELTAREHIELYAGLKGIPKDVVGKIIEDDLSAVRLLKVVDRPVSSYSGGYK